MGRYTNDVKRIINDNELVIWSLSFCEHCKAAKEMTARFPDQAIVEVDLTTDPEGVKESLDEVLEQYYGIEHRSFPRIFYKKGFIGGRSDLERRLRR